MEEKNKKHLTKKEFNAMLLKVVDEVHALIKRNDIKRRKVGIGELPDDDALVIRIAWLVEKKKIPVYPRKDGSTRFILTSNNLHKDSNASDDVCLAFNVGMSTEAPSIRMTGFYLREEIEKMANDVFDFLFFGTWPTEDGIHRPPEEPSAEENDEPK